MNGFSLMFDFYLVLTCPTPSLAGNNKQPSVHSEGEIEAITQPQKKITLSLLLLVPLTLFTDIKTTDSKYIPYNTYLSSDTTFKQTKNSMCSNSCKH